MVPGVDGIFHDNQQDHCSHFADFFRHLFFARATRRRAAIGKHPADRSSSKPFCPPLTAGTNAPELYTGENVDVGPQRILRLNPAPGLF